MRRVLIIVTVLLLLTSCSKMTTSTDEPYPDTLPSGTTSQSNPPGSSSTPSPGALAEAVKAAPAVLENIDQYEDYYIYPNEFIWSCFTVDEDGIVYAAESENLMAFRTKAPSAHMTYMETGWRNTSYIQMEM